MASQSSSSRGLRSAQHNLPAFQSVPADGSTVANDVALAKVKFSGAYYECLKRKKEILANKHIPDANELEYFLTALVSTLVGCRPERS